jgi:hypothetical protein
VAALCIVCVASIFVKGMLAAVSDRKASEHNQKIISNISHQISAQRFFSKQQTDPRSFLSLGSVCRAPPPPPCVLNYTNKLV